MQVLHQQLNYHQIYIPKHCIKIRARISSIKFTINHFSQISTFEYKYKRDYNYKIMIEHYPHYLN